SFGAVQHFALIVGQGVVNGNDTLSGMGHKSLPCFNMGECSGLTTAGGREAPIEAAATHHQCHWKQASSVIIQQRGRIDHRIRVQSKELPKRAQVFTGGSSSSGKGGLTTETSARQPAR